MDVTPEQMMTSKEKLSKALEDIRDVVNAADVNVETVVKEYDKFAAVYDKVSIDRNHSRYSSAFTDTATL